MQSVGAQALTVVALLTALWMLVRLPRALSGWRALPRRRRPLLLFEAVVNASLIGGCMMVLALLSGAFLGPPVSLSLLVLGVYGSLLLVPVQVYVSLVRSGRRHSVLQGRGTGAAALRSSQ